jgi:hypothetical protein
MDASSPIACALTDFFSGLAPVVEPEGIALSVLLIVDNFIQPALIGGTTRLPFLLALIGILGGSIARAINVAKAQPNNQGVATVSPIFTWVRLAQRTFGCASTSTSAAGRHPLDRGDGHC